MIDLENKICFHSPGYVIGIYNDGKQDEIIIGNREIKPTRKECNSDTLYDIASLTKVYTSVLVYIAYEEGRLDIYERVKNIDERFEHLHNVRVIDLLAHNQEIWTNGYLANADTKEEFYKILFSSSVKSHFPTYVDAHYIILSTLLEKIYNKSYDKILEEKIIKKLNLSETTVYPTGDNIASNNYETLNNEIIDAVRPGLIHDKKGRKAKSLGIITGHASIFTTAGELLEFLKSFLNNSLLKAETIRLMLSHNDRNRLNYEILKNIVQPDDINMMYKKALEIAPDIKVMKTYNNMGVRYRNNIDILNDLPKKCSENTVAFSGYTGPSFIIDFDRRIIIAIMCNVMHCTKLARFDRKHYTDMIIDDLYSKLL